LDCSRALLRHMGTLALTNFNKYHGAGNDFIIIDDREEKFVIDSSRIAELCHRQYGIGSDGLILLQNSQTADARMRIFNAKDGKESPMCGNGLRCLVGFMRDAGHKQKSCVVETANKTYLCHIEDNIVEVDMGIPTILQTDGKVDVYGEEISFLWLDSGVPHLVCFVDTLDIPDFLKKARFISKHPHIVPSGINVNFARVDSSGTVHVRTYERGVEAETFACGTGGAAVCTAAWKLYGISEKVPVIFASQEKLDFEVSAINEKLQGIKMRGPIKSVFTGTLKL